MTNITEYTDPYELQNRLQETDLDDQELQMLNSISDRILFRFEEFEPFISRLPQREIDLLEMYYREEKNQKEIAEFFGVTQGAISHRLSRAKKRLSFLKKMPKISEEDLIKRLNPYFTTFETDLIVYMVETTCQSKTSKMLNTKYNLQDKDKMTQIKVRHKFERFIDKIKIIKKADKDLRDCYKLLMYVKSHLYMLHEVVLPHFNRGKYAIWD